MAARMFRWLIRSRAVQIVWILMWESEHQEILFQEVKIIRIHTRRLQQIKLMEQSIWEIRQLMELFRLKMRASLHPEVWFGKLAI